MKCWWFLKVILFSEIDICEQKLTKSFFALDYTKLLSLFPIKKFHSFHYYIVGIVSPAAAPPPLSLYREGTLVTMLTKLAFKV